jgi:sugar phosphate permease
MLSLSFLRAHGRLIAFGVFMCFASSPGQTFFISLSGGEIRAAFGLSHGEFGSIYSTGTLASAAILVWLGRLIDRVPLAAFSSAVLVALAVICLLMGIVEGAVALLLALFGLRLFGQGLASHAAITAMGRYFVAERGRAVGIASLGHTLGEAIFPALVVAALVVASWRSVWTGAGVALLVATPLVFVLLRGQRARDHALKARRTAAGAGAADRTLGAALRDPGLWLRMPALLAPSFIFTGIIFHQVHLAASKGWPLSLMAGSFTVYAVAAVASLIVAGRLVDKVSARRLVPVFLAPFALACLVLGVSDAPAAAPLALVLFGIGTGGAAVVMGAVWAELYGITHLGAIRAFAHSAMVFSSGLAPAVMGILVDGGYSMEAIALASVLFCLAASALSTLAARPQKVVSVSRTGS